MGKSSAPSTPDYTKSAIATANASKYNETNPYGSVSWSMRAGADPTNPQPGDYSRTTSFSAPQQALYDQGVSNQLAAGSLASSQMAQLSSDNATASSLADKLYKQSTKYYDQNYGNQEAALRTQLLNSGLAEGSAGYQNAMDKFNQQRNSAYGDAANTAAINAEQQSQTEQNNAVNRLAQIMSMSHGQAPNSSNNSALSQDLTSAAANSYNSQLAATNAANAQTSSTIQGLGQLGLLAYLLW